MVDELLFTKQIDKIIKPLAARNVSHLRFIKLRVVEIIDTPLLLLRGANTSDLMELVLQTNTIECDCLLFHVKCKIYFNLNQYYRFRIMCFLERERAKSDQSDQDENEEHTDDGQERVIVVI